MEEAVKGNNEGKQKKEAGEYEGNIQENILL